MHVNKVLIVDDEAYTLELLVKFLKDLRDEVVVLTANNGLLACKVAENKLPDLILMDWDMPVMNGIEAIKYLKTKEETRDIPVVMITSKTGLDDLKTGFEVGVIDYIRKPVEKTELLARVRSMLLLVKSINKIKDQNAFLEQQHNEILEQRDKIFELLNDRMPYVEKNHLILPYLESIRNLTDSIRKENDVDYKGNGRRAKNMQLLEKVDMIINDMEKELVPKQERTNTVEQIDLDFINNVKMKIVGNILNPEMNYEVLAEKMNMGQTTLYRKIKEATGLSVNNFIRHTRLEVASEHLKKGKHNVSEVAFMVGFKSPIWFSQAFSEQFGVSPKVYMKNNQQK